jgi:DNA-binding NarL/FixJ family response regulator
MNWSASPTSHPGSNPSSLPKILLVENDKILLTMMANALHAKGYGIVGTASNAATGYSYFEKITPDVAILDIFLGAGPSGVDLATKMRIRQPNLAILFCTSFADPRFARTSSRLLSRCAYLPKQSITKMDQLTEQIAEAQRLVRFPEEEAQRLVVPSELSSLSNGDIELLELISAGFSNKEIAAKREITVKSCENAIARLAKKLDVPHNTETNQRVILAKKYISLSGKDI